MSFETSSMANSVPASRHPRLMSQKRPLKPKEVWAIRTRLQMEGRKRDLALFNLAIDSKLRSCDLVGLRIDQIESDGHVRERATIVQKKTGRPVQFELTETTRTALTNWLSQMRQPRREYVFPSRISGRPHLSTRQYSRLLRTWIKQIGLEPSAYDTHSLRRTKAAELYRKTGNLRAVQILLGHMRIESTVRYLGVDVDDALKLSEQVEM